jgi:hypothetical protein
VAAANHDDAQPPRVLEATAEDPDLSPRQRQALTQVYEAFVMTRKRPRHQ